MRAGAAGSLLSWLGEREPEMVGLLERLAGEETPSQEPAAQRGARSLVARELERLCFAVRTVRAAGVGDHLLARPRDRRRGAAYQLLVGHIDTVWPRGTLERMPVRRADGRLEGPGVYDMKGGLVQLVFALRALRAAELEPAATPVVFVNSDEEIGSPDSTRHLTRLARGAARAFVLEPSFGLAGALKTARKGVGRFELTVVGRASHAGLAPEAGVSAILELSHQVQRLFALNDADRGVTVNVGTIDGGLRPNVVAPEASALIEARVRTGEDAAHVERALRELRPVQDGAALELSGGFSRPPLEPTARNRALWRTAEAAASELGVELEQAAVGGASDGNTTSRFTATLDGLGPVGGGAHAPDEHIVVTRLAERAALLALLMAAPVEGG